MENQYGIQVANKYELFLDEDEDPFDILARQEEEKNKNKDDKSKKDSKNEKNAKSNKNKKNQKPLINQQEPKTKQNEERAPTKDDKPRSANQTRQGGERGPRRDRDTDRDRNLNKENKTPFPRGDRKPADPTSPSSEFRDRVDRPESGRGRGGFRRGRGRGIGRGGFGGDRDREQRSGSERDGFDRFGKRDYERHSGSDRTSGVKATDKRDGSGAHNWGTVRDDMEDTFNESNLSEEAPADWTAPAEETENPEAAAVEGEVLGVTEDPGQAEMSLEEYKAQQQTNRMKADFKIRRAGEGVDDAQWKKMTVLKKKPPQDSDEEDEEDEDDEEWDERKGARKAKVDIEITFNDNPRRGGRRGGRGMGRGRGEGMGRGRGEGMGRGRGEGMGRGRGRGEGMGRGRGRGEGGPRGGRGGFRGGTESAPRVDDEIDFPSLGKAAAS